ncbi:MAG: ABC transporter ATP-binding protein [Planctomycetales bacterium]
MDTTSVAPQSDRPPVLQVDGLGFQYPNGHPALRDISFALQPGEVVGLLGANGAGKTTLMLHLNGLLPGSGTPQTGSIRVQGHPVQAENYRLIRRLVGFLFQDPDDQLFCPTVIEDVAFGPLNLGLDPSEVRDRVTTALQSVGLSGFEDRHTHQLSFGERKRVALAGILACHPEILILDEPSSNLDARARRRFMEILKECKAAQLIASHDLDLIVEHCSRVIILDQGRVQAQGPAREILANATLLSRYGLEVPLSLQLEKLTSPQG